MEFTELVVIPVYFKTDSERVEFRLSKDSRNRYYLRFGKSYFDLMEEQWFPTKEGATIPLSVETGQAMLEGMSSILALAEYESIIGKVLNGKSDS